MTEASGSMTTARRMIIATTNTLTHWYSFWRNAFAPFWISVIRKTMRSLPGDAFSTTL